MYQTTIAIIVVLLVVNVILTWRWIRRHEHDIACKKVHMQHEKQLRILVKNYETRTKKMSDNFAGYLKLLDKRLDEKYEKVAERIIKALNLQLSKKDKRKLKS